MKKLITLILQRAFGIDCREVNIDLHCSTMLQSLGLKHIINGQLCYYLNQSVDAKTNLPDHELINGFIHIVISNISINETYKAHLMTVNFETICFIRDQKIEYKLLANLFELTYPFEKSPYLRNKASHACKRQS